MASFPNTYFWSAVHSADFSSTPSPFSSKWFHVLSE